MKPHIEPFFDAPSGTFSYVVFEASGGHCAIVDSVLGYDASSGYTSTEGAERIIDFVQSNDLHVQWHLETHVHADHLSAAAYLRKKLGGKIAMSSRIVDVRRAFGHVFNLPNDPATHAAGFDHLFDDGDTFLIGSLPARVIAVPGHTPADIAYQICEEAVFVGDTLFMPDVGTARCDFPGGDAAALFRSIHTLLSLPDQTRLYMCHDYPPATRAPSCIASVKQQREQNIHVHDGITQNDFVAMRTSRDAELSLPQLIIPSIQVNMHAGELPPEESNGVRYLKIPIDTF